VGAISYPAASLWPYKLTIAILKLALGMGLNLQTNTAVTDILPDGTDMWKVVASTSTISAGKVIHATNGYASYLLPEFEGRIIPLKGHVSAIPPSVEYRDKPLDKTMALIWELDYDYLIQRQVAGKHLILGGRDLDHPEGLLAPLGDSDDSFMSGKTVQGLNSLPQSLFESWSKASTSEGESLEDKVDIQSWTGIMGITKDSVPFLGEIPKKKGQYIAAGYSGHGKSRCWVFSLHLC
jgi:glycine/D-amino acid oxidase-like deaminating enzyme